MLTLENPDTNSALDTDDTKEETSWITGSEPDDGEEITDEKTMVTRSEIEEEEERMAAE